MKPVTFVDLVSVIDSLPYKTGIYTEIPRWEDEPLRTTLYLASGDEEGEEDFDARIEAAGLREFYRLQTLQDIVAVERRTRPNAKIEDLVAAAKYYRKYDTFRP